MVMVLRWVAVHASADMVLQPNCRHWRCLWPSLLPRRMGLRLSVAIVVRPVCAREYMHIVHDHTLKINIET